METNQKKYGVIAGIFNKSAIRLRYTDLDLARQVQEHLRAKGYRIGTNNSDLFLRNGYNKKGIPTITLEGVINQTDVPSIMAITQFQIARKATDKAIALNNTYL